MIRKYMLVNGIVQAVGFRPFVYKLALSWGLSGFCANTDKGVIIEVQGTQVQIDNFTKCIYTDKPQLSIIDSLKIKDIPPTNQTTFFIKHSSGKNAATAIPADIAICSDCRADIATKDNRRYHYPFTNCTACGPRFSIIKTVPYDRAKTTMHKFKMCPLCQAEFDDPLNRRFHAQPNCCPVCGPQLFLKEGKKIIKKNALELACKQLLKGKIVIIKSLGGFHIACNALDIKAIAKLRTRKNRPHKPLAIMCNNIQTVKKYCFVNAAEAALLSSPQAPIVMLKKKAALPLIADKLATIGVMLPYTPLHKVIFDIIGDTPLIMTSANIQHEPICITNKEALQKLSHIADSFLLHNRDIYNRIDDSLVFELNGKAHFLRRARGFVPIAFNLIKPVRQPILALGGDITSAFCLAKASKLYLSQYIGDLDNADNIRYYKQTLAKMRKLFNINPKIFAGDLHPQYFGTRFAPKAKKVQHHLAHALSVMAEHNLDAPAIAFSFDGIGLGSDGNIWGGEILTINKNTWQRVGALETINIIGGDSASIDIWKTALSYMLAAKIKPATIKQVLGQIKITQINTAINAWQGTINCYKASSFGRLFDAIACIAGLRCFTTYQAQAALELQSLYKPLKLNPYIFEVEDKNNFLTIKTAPLIAQVVKDRATAATISYKFHTGAAQLVLNTAKIMAAKTGIKNIILAGGVFQNEVLLALTQDLLLKQGFNVYTNNAAPAGDGALALGQAYAIYKNFV